MINRFRHWLRAAVISDWILWTALTAVLAVWVGQRVLILWLAAFAPELTEAEMGLVTRPAHVFALLPFAVLYGLYRACMFHPIAHRSYGTWLAQTPWRYPKPLPLGPLVLTWQDVVVHGMLLSLALLPPYGELKLLYMPPILFLAAYCGALAYVHWLLNANRALTGVLLLAAGSLLVIKSPWALLVVALLMYGVTYFGIADSLRDFPYSEQRRTALGLVPFERPTTPDVPWPIVPTEDHWMFHIGRGQALILGLLIGAIIFGVAIHIRDEANFARGMLLVHTMIALVCIAVRLIIYTSGCWPPISLFGRVVTRRPIIPGYDVVFVAPILIAVIATMLPYTIPWIGFSPIVAIPLSTAVTVWLTLSLPPRLKKWYYTGHYRIPAVRRGGQHFVQS